MSRSLHFVVLVLSTLVLTTSVSAALVGQYTFESTLPSVDPLIVDYTPDVSPSGLGFPMARMVNGATYASANSLGQDSMGDSLGTSGRVTSPSSGSNHFAFWVNKGVLATSSDWTISLWAKRAGTVDNDALVYIGASDGFGGGSAETYVIVTPSGILRAENYTSSSNTSSDMLINSGAAVMTPGAWYMVTAVREGASFSLYLDDQLVGYDSSVTINSLGVSLNSVIVFGGVKSLSNTANRNRMFDGLIDNVSIFNHALTALEVREQYEATFVPEPSSCCLALLAAAPLLGNVRWRTKSPRS